MWKKTDSPELALFLYAQKSTIEHIVLVLYCVTKTTDSACVAQL